MASRLCDWLRKIIKENAGIFGGISRILYVTLGVGAAFKVVSIAVSAFAKIISPLALAVKYLDGIVSGTSAAAKAEAAKAAQAATATANAEKLKELAKNRSDAVRTASDNRRHYMELKNAAAEAQAVTVAEAQKVTAAKNRVAQEAALNAQARRTYIATTGSSKGYRQTPGFAAAKADLKAQEAAMAKSIETTRKTAAAADTARVATLQSAMAAKTATAAYTAEAAAQSAVSKKSIIHGAALGRLNVIKLFSAAMSRKHAEAVLTASLAEMVAAKRGAGASALKTTWYYLEAIAAKIAAGATVALNAALTALCKHPIMIALLALGAAVVGIATAASMANKELEKTAEKAKEASAAATEEREAGDEKRQKSQIDMQRLNQLAEISKRARLSADEMAEAEKLINALDPFGASQWSNLDKLTGHLTLAADAQKQYNEAMRQAATAQVEAEIAAQENAIRKLEGRLSQSAVRDFFGDTAVGNVLTLGLVDTTEQNNDPIYKDIDVEFKKMLALKKRLNALAGGNEAAVTGKDDETTKNRVEQENQRIAASKQELADAAKRLSELEGDAAKRKRSDMENELYDIRKVREEYRKNIRLLLQEEQAKLNVNRDAMNANRKGESEQQRTAYKNAFAAARENQKTIESLETRSNSAEIDFGQQIADTIEKEKNSASILNQLIPMFNVQMESLRRSRDAYIRATRVAKSIDSAGGETVTDAEQLEIDRLYAGAYSSRIQADALWSKINEARQAATDAVNSAEQKTTGSWRAENLSRELGSQSMQERAARAAEGLLEKATETNKYLRTMADGGRMEYA